MVCPAPQSSSPSQVTDSEASPLRGYHRASAIVLGLFLAIHLTNHLVGLFGQAEHMAFMQAVRPLYRNAFVEPLLVALFAWQIVSGTAMVIRGWSARRGTVAWLQAGSGLYLALFIVIHTVSVFGGRLALGLDTDFRFAAAGLHVPGWPWFFAPYYALAVFALFAHVGCAIYWNTFDRNRRAAVLSLKACVALGSLFGLLIVAALSGRLYSVEIPARYQLTFGGH